MKKIFLLAFICISCNSDKFDLNGDLELKRSLINIIYPISAKNCNSDSVTFKLDTVTKFSWDKVYFFYGYADTTQLKQRIGDGWIPKSFRLNGYDNVFVFLKNGNVVNHVGFKPNLDSVFFVNRADIEGFYTPKNAYFTYKKMCDTNYQTGHISVLKAVNNN